MSNVNVAVSFQSGVELFVTHFAVEEHLSAAFLIQLDASGPADIDPRGIVGRGVVFAIQGLGGRRVWTGVCTRITQTQRMTGSSSAYAVTIGPALWLLSRRSNYRAYQNLSVPEIAQSLLAEWGISPILRLDLAAYPKLEYRVQYGETDYNFLRRQLAEAGISFSFACSEDKESKVEETRLVLSDAIEHSEPRAQSLPFVVDSGLSNREEQVAELTVTSEVRPGHITLRDHDFRRPMYGLFGQQTTKVEPESLLEQYVYEPGVSAAAGKADGSTPVADQPLAYRQTDGVATTRARLLGESLRPGGLAMHFTTSAVDLAPGMVIKVTGHAHPAVSSEKGLLVVEAWHSGAREGEWSHTVLAVPATDPFRPPQAALSSRGQDHTGDPDIFAIPLVPQKPHVAGIESAIVAGPKGEEIHVDELGRVRVRFHWDREDHGDQSSSCWVRVSQASAGAGFGTTFLPRVGQEVLVAFVGGDPDLPVVVGRVHSPTSPAPFILPKHKTRSGIRTTSSPGGRGFNEIMLDDAKGHEIVSLRAERDLLMAALHDRTAHVGKIDATVAGKALRLFIADSATGIELSDGKIVLTTGEASIVLEGGVVSVFAGSTLVTPTWVVGGAKGSIAAPPSQEAPSATPKPAPATPPAEAKPESKPEAKPAAKPAVPGQTPCVKLGVNKKFKPAILEASQRTGISPHAISATMDAEAAKLKGGHGEWNPRSYNPDSHAAGMTQFVPRTWTGMATKPGTLLNDVAVEKGFVEQSGKNFTVVAGKMDELQELRYDSRLSIVSSAELARAESYPALEKAGFITDATTEDELARLLYIGHHEGISKHGGAVKFLNDEYSDSHAKHLLEVNTKERAAGLIAQEDGDAKAAYKKWLTDYTTKHIVPSKYKCSDECVDGDEVDATSKAPAAK
jgi:type VI secretion system secreted protein VgrG